MTSTQFLELFASLTLQLTIVVFVTHWIGTTLKDHAQCRLWTICYGMIFVLLVMGITLPHLRLFHAWPRIHRSEISAIAGVQIQLGRHLFFIWLAGTVTSLVLFVYRTIRISRFLKSCTPVQSDRLSLPREVDQMFPANGKNTSDVTILSSPRLIGPFCWQFHRPYIVLPAALIDMENESLRFVIRHELDHLRNGHPLQLFLQRVVEILFWFHPLVWWAAYRSNLVREFACDTAVARDRAEISAYLKALLSLVEFGIAVNGNARPTLSFGRGEGSIGIRARRLVRRAHNDQRLCMRKERRVLSTVGLIAASLAAACLWIPVDMLASPRSQWSPWPTWSSAVLHDVGVHAPDFDVFDHHLDAGDEFNDH